MSISLAKAHKISNKVSAKLKFSTERIEAVGITQERKIERLDFLVVPENEDKLLDLVQDRLDPNAREFLEEITATIDGKDIKILMTTREEWEEALTRVKRKLGIKETE